MSNHVENSSTPRPQQQCGFDSNAESQSLKRPRPITSRITGLEDNRSKMAMTTQTHSSQPVCLQFRRWGHCSYGIHYSILGPWKGHGVDEDQRNVDKLKRCSFFFSGKQCPYGNKCIYLHEYDKKFERGMARSDAIEPKRSVDLGKKMVKTKICNLWKRDGRCTYGSNCQFAHGNAELQSLGSSNPLELKSSAGISAPAMNAASSNETSSKRRFLFKLTNIQKISEIYADWIEMPIVPLSSGTLDS